MKKNKIALERVEILFKLAKEEYNNARKDLADRYVFIAKRIAMKVNMVLPVEYKRQFCNQCGSFWVLGENATKRTKNKIIEYTCHKCKKKKRIPIGLKS